MKIGFDFRMGGTGHAGIGRYAQEILLSCLRQADDDTFIVFFNDSVEAKLLKTLAQFPNVVLQGVNARHYSFAEQIEFLRVLEKSKCDIVHFPNFNHPLRFRGKFVVTVHDMIHHRLSGHKPTHYLHFLAYKKIMEHAILASNGIITPSIASKADIVEEAQKFSAVMKNKIRASSIAEKTQVIYEGTSLGHPSAEEIADIKKRFRLERPYFLFVGTLERKKNVPGLVSAFDLFLDKYKMDMDLVIVGKTDRHYPEEREKIMQARHHDRLVLTGYVNDNELSALYGGAYAYVSLSPNEGFGLPGVEALSFGLPIITVNVPVANEIYDSSALYCEAGNVEDASEKMHLLARDAQFYARQVEASFKKGQDYSWEKAGSATLEVYRKALRGELSA